MKSHLVIQTAFIGDLFLSIPFLKHLRKVYPDHKIAILCRRGTGEFLLNTGLVDEVIEVNKKDKKSFKEKLNRLYQKNFDGLFCLHESIRSHLISKKIKAEFKVGFYKPWNFWIFNKRVKKNYTQPDAIRQFSLLQAVDPALAAEIEKLSKVNETNLAERKSIGDQFIDNPIPEEFSMNISNQVEASRFLQGIDGYREGLTNIFIAPGSVWATKRWTLEGFIQLAREYQQQCNVFLVGSPNEQELCQRIKERADRTIDLSGKTTLFELAGLFKQGQVLVTNDSGSMHVAATVGLPTVSIFGPTTLSIGYRPWNDKATVVQSPVSCRPCGKHGHQKCPIKTHECMESIACGEVKDQVNYFLEKFY